MKKYFFVSLIFLFACATPYKPPEGMPTANLVVKNMTPNVVFGAAFDDSKECQGQHGFVVGAGAESKLDILAGKPFAFVLQLLEGHSRGYGECVFLPTFIPETGRAYEVLFERSQNTCFFQLRSDDGRKVVSVQREWKKSNGFSDNSCEEMSDSEKNMLY